MVKVSDYIAKFIADSEHLSSDVFLVAGGGCMHLLDSVGREPGLRFVCNHHEQACTIAAEGYARVSGKVGVALVTTGPGGTNAITGVMGAWVDSIPMLVLSGQVKIETTILAASPGLRQLGDQEINIIDIARPITKYAVMITDPREIRYHLEKAVYLARSGRPGPVWIDVPLDVQSAIIDEDTLSLYDPDSMFLFDPEKANKQIEYLLSLLDESKRPAMIVGNGIRLAGAKDDFIIMAEALGIPVLTAISGIDLIPSEHRLFYGRPGILGERAANFIMQNCDLLLVLGTRMNLRIIGYAFDSVARAAKKVMVDIDEHELNKRTFKPDLKIQADAGWFINLVNTKIRDGKWKRPEIKDWLDYCSEIKSKYPVVTKDHYEIKPYVSSYWFAEILSRCTRKNEIIVTGNGCAYTSTFQAIKIKEGQRVFANVGCAAMGYDLPAAIGACFANNKHDVVLITGDGSIQMNLQELQTIVHYQLPIKIFMFNNDGYLSIKITQNNFFKCRYTGCEPKSGVSFPNMTAIASAYGIKTVRIVNHAELEDGIKQVLATAGPILCEVMLNPQEILEPKAFSFKKADGTMVSRPLEDLYPFLDRQEFLRNMLIDPVEASR